MKDIKLFVFILTFFMSACSHTEGKKTGIKYVERNYKGDTFIISGHIDRQSGGSLFELFINFKPKKKRSEDEWYKIEKAIADPIGFYYCKELTSLGMNLHYGVTVVYRDCDIEKLRTDGYK